MVFFRKYRVALAWLMLLSIGLFFMDWPARSRVPAGESVSSWLQDLRSDTRNPVVSQKIQELRKEQGDIPFLLRKATVIVRHHSADFALPVDPEQSSDEDIYNTLLLKWTLRHHDVAVQAVIVPDRSGQQGATSPEKNDQTLWSNVSQFMQTITRTFSRVVAVWDFVRQTLKPLSSSIAIGAP